MSISPDGQPAMVCSRCDTVQLVTADRWCSKCREAGRCEYVAIPFKDIARKEVKLLTRDEWIDLISEYRDNKDEMEDKHKEYLASKENMVIVSDKIRAQLEHERVFPINSTTESIDAMVEFIDKMMCNNSNDR